VTVTNDQAERQTEAQDEAGAYRQAAAIYHHAGIRSDDKILAAIAGERPESIGRVRDALVEVEADREAGG